jgi:hypothetical protein
MRRDKSPVTSRVVALSRQERDLLYRMYIEQDRTGDELAAILGFSVRFIYNRLKAHGIAKTKRWKPEFKYCRTCGQAWEKRKRSK